MSVHSRLAIVFAMVAGSASSALAGALPPDPAIKLTFSSPPTTREIIYTQPGAGDTFGVMTFDAATVVLEIQLNDFGIAAPLLITSTLKLNVLVGPSSPGSVPNQNVATTFGTFSFEEAGVPLLTGEFNDDALSRRRNAGGLEASGLMQSPQFTVTILQPLLDRFLLAGFNFPGFDTTRFGDLAFTLTNILQNNPADPAVVSPNGDEQFLSSFRADSAFTATIPVIPTPGSVGLALAAGVVAMGWRRRQA